MGLGLWFIREFDLEKDKTDFTAKFIKIQTGLGLLFYIINIVLAFILYSDDQIRWLSIILGSNIIFDNIIYSIKTLNVAEFKQKKTFVVLILDGVFRFILGCIVFFFPFSIITLSIFLIVLRFLTVNLFLSLGSSQNLNFRKVIFSIISWIDVKNQIFLNWKFVVIGSIAVIYWRIANIIIAKNLSLQDVADYEISFKVLSIFMILPIVTGTTIYSKLVKYYNSGDTLGQKKFYSWLFWIYTIYSVFSYTFIYSFADFIILFAFGEQYVNAIQCLKEIFLTILLFPTVLLQANLIVALKREKIDMWLNILSLLTYLLGSLVGLTYFKTLSVINYSIFFSFIVFHVSQNIFLIKKGFTDLKTNFIFYLLVLTLVLTINHFF
jgi:O-antigen/teichoic acid export membrane protein